jgi:hypothetical protein
MEPADEELLGLMPQQLRDDLATVARMAAHGAGPDVTPELFEASLTAGALQFVRVALAEPMAEGPAVPEGREPASVVGEPSDEELLELWQGWNLGWDPQKGTVLMPHPAEYARAVLARWGHQPAPPAEGEVADLVAWMHEVADLVAWMHDEADQYDCIQQAPETACKLRRAADLLSQHHPAPVPERAANPWKDALIDALACAFLLTTENESDPKKALHDLISWETRLAMDPSINPLMRPVPVSAPPAEGEVVGLVEGLNLISDGMDAMGHESDSWFVARAADLLAQRHPTPVPVSKRLPGPEDCDAEGTCWAWHGTATSWGLFRLDPTVHSHWLPAHALPLPAGEVE